MKILKLTGLLMMLSVLAVGCSSDDDVNGGEPAELYVYVRDASDNYLLEGADVEFVQDDRLLCIDTTDGNGLALCDNYYDGLVSGTVTINIYVVGYKPFTKTGRISAGSNEWEVSLTPDETMASLLTVTSGTVEDLYGTISILMPQKVQYVRVSEGTDYNAEDYTEYTNDQYGYGTTTQNVTYNNLLPDTKYTFTVVAFDGKGKQIDKKTISITTKSLYNRSDKEVSVTDFTTLTDGIAVTLKESCNFYLACYEAGKAPADEMKILKDALSTPVQTDSSIGYVYGLESGKNYFVYIIPTDLWRMDAYGGFDINVPGKMVSVNVSTISSGYQKKLTVDLVESTKTSIKYRLRKDFYDMCSFKKLEVSDYDRFEELPDIAFAVLCKDKSLTNLNTYNTASIGDYTWNGLNLSSWYGIISWVYEYQSSKYPSGVISRYKFKYGSYGVTRSAGTDIAPAQASGIRYGSVTDDMLRNVRILK